MKWSLLILVLFLSRGMWLPVVDFYWFRYKLPGSFQGSGHWTGKWQSAVNRNVIGRIVVKLPANLDAASEFSVDAALYYSINSSYRRNHLDIVQVTVDLESGESTNGVLRMQVPDNETPAAIAFKTMVSSDQRTIAGSFERQSPNDIGTFSLHKM